jgi:hypothetical protein
MDAERTIRQVRSDVRPVMESICAPGWAWSNHARDRHSAAGELWIFDRWQTRSGGVGVSSAWWRRS